MTNLILLEVVNDNMALSLLESDEVLVDLSQKPRGNGQELGVFKVNGELFISKFTKFGKQILFIQNSGIKTMYSDMVEVIGTVVGVDYELSIEKATAVTGASNAISLCV